MTASQNLPTADLFADGTFVTLPAYGILDVIYRFGVNTILVEGMTDRIERVEYDLDNTLVVIHGPRTVSAFDVEEEIHVAVHD